MAGKYRIRSKWSWQILFLPLFMIQTGLGHPFAGGDGTAANPYQIATAAQLQAIGSQSQFLDKRYILIQDIDLQSGLPVGSAMYGPYVGGQAFEGYLDGRGHLVRNLRIVSSYTGKLGLFGQIGPNGCVMDLHIDGGQIDTEYEDVGLLAGRSAGYIVGCSASGRAKGNSRVGLLVGTQSGGAIIYCHVDGKVAGSYCGGLVGQVVDGRVVGCTAKAGFDASGHNCGGLVGALVGGSVEDCIAQVHAVLPWGYNLGGLVGLVEAGTVVSCLAVGELKTHDVVAGLVAVNRGTIRSCYSLCSVQADQIGAGLVGQNEGSILFCYAAGQIEAGRPAGLVYSGSGAYLSYWDIQATGVQTSAAGLGRSTVQMRQAKTFRGWGYDGVWVMSEGSYPRLCGRPLWIHR